MPAGEQWRATKLHRQNPINYELSLLPASIAVLEGYFMKIQSILSIMAVLLIALSACTAKPSRPDDAVTLIIRFEASTQGVEELTQIMDGVSGAMAAEPGYISAKVFRDIDNPNVFVLEEVWATKKLHQEHFTRIDQSGDWSHINSLLIEEPSLGYYKSM